MAKELEVGDISNSNSERNELPKYRINVPNGDYAPAKEPFPGFYKPKDEDFRTFIYNSEEKSVLGRTAKRWGICLQFYLCFYICLASFWMILFFTGMNPVFKNEGPWIAPQDVPFFGPGLSFVPRSTRIKLNSDAYKSIKILNNFTKGYQNLNPKDYKDCRVTISYPENCYFDVLNLGECAPGGSYGYHEQKPCIILKFNRAYGMKFYPYKKNDKLPTHMPADLKKYIKASNQSMNKLWLSCEGDRNEDKIALDKIQYWPDRAFDNYYYPFLGHSKHLSPLVAIKVSMKKRVKSVMIFCQLWGKNISTDKEHGSNTKIILEFDKK